MVVAGGSRGDVQPLVSLAQAIKSAGHDVTVVATQDTGRLITDHGLAFEGFDLSAAAQLATEAGRAWTRESAGRPMRELRYMRQFYEQMAEPVARGLLALSGRADLFVSGILSFDAVASIAAHDGVAHAIALLAPFHPSADGRSGLTALNPRTHRANLTRTRIGRYLLARSATQVGRRVRVQLGLRETGPRGLITALDTTPTVLGASPLLVPPPPDWPPTVTVTGPWLLPAPEAWRPPKALADFLVSGPPPIYLGFGSMSGAQPQRTHDLAIAAARATGHRLLLAGTGLTGLDGADVFGISDAPHGWLFPRTCAAVHHGGSGTTHAALTAGVPQLAVPHLGDQPFWGRRIHEEGLGPPPLPLNRLTLDSLTTALRTLTTTPHLCVRAAALGELTRSEQGAIRARDSLLSS